VSAEIFRDLKSLDEKLQKVSDLIESCTQLFDSNYRDTVDGNPTFSWPYSVNKHVDPSVVHRPAHEYVVEDKAVDVHWPNYAEKFPDNPNLSPSTSALCGWAVSRVSSEAGETSEAGKRLEEYVDQAAKNLGELQASRLESETFKLVGEIFLHAQVLRFLAATAQYKSRLFKVVFARVRQALEEPGKELHPFLLHYCVLAWEQLRNPAVKLADQVIEISKVADKISELRAASKKADSLTLLIDLLGVASQLRDALESFATTLNQTLPDTKTRERLDKLAAKTNETIQVITGALTKNRAAMIPSALSSLEKLIDEGIQAASKVLRALPKEITGIASTTKLTTSPKLRAIADTIKNRPWYSRAFRERLGNEVVRQISYSASAEESHLDVGALAYSLAAVLHSDALHLPQALSRKALAIIFDHQRGGRWNEIQPMARTATGFVHYPLNIEIANAVLSMLRSEIYADAPTVWTHLDDVMDWVVATANKVGPYRGWCSEHDYSQDRIDLWATAQVAQFLLDYREVRCTLTTRSAMERAGMVTVSPNSVGTSWTKLQPSDLEKNEPNDQIKNKLRDKFVTPHKRLETPRSSSVLLYGPPGTSKTSIMEALANKLGWRFLQITPADFLSVGSEQVEARATLLFEILRRAKDIVVLFDEVDEFLLDRELENRPEGIFRFMTTSMLPKLQSLKSRGSLIFGIATNYKERLDKAITRLGRVDHDWAVLPPDFTSRIVLIKTFADQIDAATARQLAANTPFFSFLELKKVALEQKRSVGMRIETWKVVPHPTASPEAYGNRPGLAEEFPALLREQISVSALAQATSDTKNRLRKQLKDFEGKRLQNPSSETENEAIGAVQEVVKNLG
jgi:SpoVK/Ycf46/Vps4 family AAA+-type ATPase